MKKRRICEFEMNALYLDIFSGISGDMFLGAMIDLGVAPEKINDALKSVSIGKVRIESSRKIASGISGVKVEVIDNLSKQNVIKSTGDDSAEVVPNEGHSHHNKNVHLSEYSHSNKQCCSDHEFSVHHPFAHSHHHESRNYREIREIIHNSALSDWVKEKSISVFARIARAEAKIHGRALDEVHFHEVGAIDSIVDIIGSCVALESLDKPRVFCAPVVDGKGFIQCAHGSFPVPAPATLEILSERGISISQCDEPGELVTPTGAAIIAEFVEKFGPMTNLKPIKIGYGLGSREGKTRPNVLRAVLCAGDDGVPNNHDWEIDRVAIIETNLDDINSEIVGNFIEKALSAGALDVYFSYAQMKKNRPAVVLHLMCDVNRADEFAELIFTETSAFGVRVSDYSRRKLKRKFVVVATPYGDIRIKEGFLNGKKIQSAPEYEDCKTAASKFGVPLRIVYEVALTEYKKTQ